ncbi:hypothetical protein WJX81_001863 [Elliptochloris bilobata]|uniref:Uncharacterized protein n=1 Tax=Elliptochloris bilobata TaxID=381761 RepID=A0AAW1S074_9CHLO
MDTKWADPGKPKRKRAPPGDEADEPNRPAQRTAPLAVGAAVPATAPDAAPLAAFAARAAELGREVAGAAAMLQQLSAAEEQVLYRSLAGRHVAAAAASEAAASSAGTLASSSMGGTLAATTSGGTLAAASPGGPLAVAVGQEASSGTGALSEALQAAHEALDERDRDAAVLRAEAEGLADVLGAAGADAAAEAAARAQLGAQLAQALRRLSKVTAELATCRKDLAACRAELVCTRQLLAAALASAASHPRLDNPRAPSGRVGDESGSSTRGIAAAAAPDALEAHALPAADGLNAVLAADQSARGAVSASFAEMALSPVPRRTPLDARRTWGSPAGIGNGSIHPSRTPRAARRSAWDSPLPAAPATGASTAALARALSSIRERERTAGRTPPAAPPSAPTPLAAVLSRGTQLAGVAGLGLPGSAAQTPLAAVLAQLGARTPGV